MVAGDVGNTECYPEKSFPDNNRPQRKNSGPAGWKRLGRLLRDAVMIAWAARLQCWSWTASVIRRFSLPAMTARSGQNSAAKISRKIVPGQP
jgi:hypothetical protein